MSSNLEARRERIAEEAKGRKEELELEEMEIERVARLAFKDLHVKELFALLKERFIDKMQVCVPGQPEGMGFYREGFNDCLRYIVKCSKAN